MNYLPRPLFLAVTDRQLICYRLSRDDWQPSRFVFAVPLAEATGSLRRRRYWDTLRCEVPLPPGRKVWRLTVPRAWQPDLETLMSTLAAAGPVSAS